VLAVTGANQGLGYQTSLELARRGATLFMVCRNEERGRAAVEAVRKDTGNPDVHLKAG
jgi:dehydrogenase/reductase SDR family protein 12